MAKNPGGRPLLFETNEALENAIDRYFRSLIIPARDENGHVIEDANGEIVGTYYKPPTLTGLAMAIGMTRETLNQYGKKDKFSCTIIKARQKVQEYAEARLYDREGANGARFMLQCNYNWATQQEQSIIKMNETNMKINIEKLEIEKKKVAIIAGDEEEENTTGVVTIPAMNIEQYEKEKAAAVAKYEANKAGGTIGS